MKNISADEITPLLVISPHLDDGVFGCGELIAAVPGATVATCFTGLPEAAAVQTDWDRACGFPDARTAMETRWREDEAALRSLGASALHLGFLDGQYGNRPGVDALAGAIEGVLAARRPRAVLMPLGLFHSDHHLVHEACCAARKRYPAPLWLAYEDALYRRIAGVLQARLVALHAAGIVATPCLLDSSDTAGQAGRGALKRAAVQMYGSQLKAFGPGGYDDTRATERFWRLDDGGNMADMADIADVDDGQ